MAETEEQYKIRREASAWLTGVINSGGFDRNLGSAIRGEVIVALSNLYSRFSVLNLVLFEKHHVRIDRPLVRFYMKGGNAFDCICNLAGPKATRLGGGDSDWDTQVMIDPWAPLPLQRLVYGLVEDIVLDEFRQVSQRIALREEEYLLYGPPPPPPPPRNFVEQTQFLWANPPPVPPPPPPPPHMPTPPPAPPFNGGIYTLDYDDPQTIRKIYDRDEVGLWTDTRQRLGDQNMAHPEWMPGHVFNAAIRHFDLYRVGYAWHMHTEVNGFPAVTRPLLMELIDVTIPRRDTIEAITVWEELAQNHINLTDAVITVDARLPDNSIDETIGRDLPLPDIRYHLRELLTMMCEVADGSSRHADKIHKRLRRFELIWDNYLAPVAIMNIAATFVGRRIETLPTPPAVGPVYNRISPELIRVGLVAGVPAAPVAGNPNPNPYLFAWKMMAEVESQTAAQQALPVFTPEGKPRRETVQAFHQARVRLNGTFYLNWLAASFSAAGAVVPLAGIYAYSDDLVLIDTLLENAYLNATHVRLSGIDQALVVRVANHDQLQLVTGRFLNRFATLAPALPAAANFTVRHKLLQTTRPHSTTHECIFVIFNAERPVAVFTLTTASPVELPFLTSPAEGEAAIPRCPPDELANQRKVMAALIDNYLIKTGISSQYELLKEIITS